MLKILKTEKNIGRNLKYIYTYNVEGKINNRVILQEAKIVEEQAFEASCKKARVSVRARSESSLVWISILFL